jgi:hypothetical protein
MKCEGKVEPKGNAVKRQRATLGGEKALLVSENGAFRLSRQIGLDLRLIRCAEGVGTGSQMHAYVVHRSFAVTLKSKGALSACQLTLSSSFAGLR